MTTTILEQEEHGSEEETHEEETEVVTGELMPDEDPRNPDDTAMVVATAEIAQLAPQHAVERRTDPAKMSTEEIYELADFAKKSGCYPNDSVLSLMMKIMLGQALDVIPAVAIQSLTTIGATISIGAEMQRALAQRAGYEIREVESTAATCTLELVREVDQKTLGRASFTMQEAVTAKLAGKDNYVKWPADMLWARCSSRLIGRYVPWVLYWKTL